MLGWREWGGDGNEGRKVFCYGFSFSIGGIVSYGFCFRVSGKKGMLMEAAVVKTREKEFMSMPPRLTSHLTGL